MRKKKPLLRQAGDLTAGDFQAHPVWVHCHIVDYDEPWYDETDEETFRPWDGALPVDPSHAIFLLRATLIFNDGSQHPGFLTPAEKPGDIGTMQPSVFVEDRCFAFWGGMPGVPRDSRAAFYDSTGRTATDIFPIRATADSSLATGEVTAILNGFYQHAGDRVICEC